MFVKNKDGIKREIFSACMLPPHIKATPITVLRIERFANDFRGQRRSLS